MEARVAEWQRVVVVLLCLVVSLATGCKRFEQLGQGARILYYGSQRPPDERVAFKSTPTRELFVHVFRPGGDGELSDGRIPIMLIHGGGFTHGWPEQYFPLATDLASRGRVVFVPEYRIQSKDGTRVREGLADVRDAFDWALQSAERYGANPELLVLGGSSSGAHYAAAAVLVPRPDGGPLPRPRGLVLAAAAVDSTSFTDPDDIFEGRGPDLSPSEHLRDDLPPVLMLAGEDDWLLPPARLFCDDLTARSVECSLKTYPDVGHAFGLYGYRDYEDMRDTIDATVTRWAGEGT